MGDSTGVLQFMSAISEFARGADAPSVTPLWQRHLLNARNPPRVTCTHPEYDAVHNTSGTHLPPGDMVDRSFLFCAADISALRSILPPDLRRCSSFEIVTACVWRCRTIALSPNPNEKVRISCVVNFGKRFNPPLVPEGYYGNVFIHPAAVTTAGTLSEKPLEYALKLVRKAKSEATEEYVRSTADLMVIRGRPIFTMEGNYLVSDMTNMGFSEVDYGWGTAAYGGAAKGGIILAPGVVSFYLSFKDEKNEKGIVTPLCLPLTAMEVFVKELEIILLAARRSFISKASTL